MRLLASPYAPYNQGYSIRNTITILS